MIATNGELEEIRHDKPPLPQKFQEVIRHLYEKFTNDELGVRDAK